MTAGVTGLRDVGMGQDHLFLTREFVVRRTRVNIGDPPDDGCFAHRRIFFGSRSQQKSTTTRSRVGQANLLGSPYLSTSFPLLWYPLTLILWGPGPTSDTAVRGSRVGKAALPRPACDCRRGPIDHEDLPSEQKSFRVDTVRAMAVELGCIWSTFFFS